MSPGQMVEVIVTTLENTRDGHDKFYRVYRVPSLDLSVLQWGSQRSGRHGGAAGVGDHDKGADQIRAKRRGGYDDVPAESDVRFNVDGDRLRAAAGTAKAASAFLEPQFYAALRNAAQPFAGPTPSAATASTSTASTPAPSSNASPFDRLSDTLLEAISQASTDPTAALVAYATVNEQFEALDAEYGKLKSYKETLDMLVEEAL